jgi:hypothetical protein
MDPYRRIGLCDSGQHSTCESRQCCSPDGANDAERLRSIREAAGEVEGTYFYSVDESGRTSGPITWPNVLASLIICWLEAGYEGGAAAVLVPAISEVRDRCWCTIDRGPPESVILDRRPDNLACALLELLDDMDLLARALGLTPELPDRAIP